MANAVQIKIAKKWRVFQYKIFKLIEDFKGIDTLKYVNSDELGFSVNTGFRYEGTSPKYLKKVLRNLNINSGDSIIDLGSGKGSALICFSKFPFKKIAGVELSKQLTEICKNNLQLLQIPNVSVINLNVCNFNEYDDYNYIYLYNPFPENVLKSVLNDLITSLNKSKRQICIIYKNPTCDKLISGSGHFQCYKEYKFRNIAYPMIDHIYLYKNIM